MIVVADVHFFLGGGGGRFEQMAGCAPWTGAGQDSAYLDWQQREVFYFKSLDQIFYGIIGLRQWRWALDKLAPSAQYWYQSCMQKNLNWCIWVNWCWWEMPKSSESKLFCEQIRKTSSVCKVWRNATPVLSNIWKALKLLEDSNMSEVTGHRKSLH